MIYLKVTGDDKEMQIVSINIPVKAIEFKSIPGMYERERDGVKSNTIRIMTNTEYNLYNVIKPDYIKITRVGMTPIMIKEDISPSFIRKVSDVIDFYHNKLTGEHVVLFSWG